MPSVKRPPRVIAHGGKHESPIILSFPLPSALLLALVTLLFAAPARAQQEDQQLWLQLNATTPLSEDVRFTVEQIARFGDRPGGLYQTEFGGLLSVRLVGNLELGMGFRQVGTHNNNTAADEERVRQQLTGSFGRFAFRLRVDERFDPRGPEIGFRLRPLLRYNHPVGRRGVALFASHESFYLPNSTEWGQRRGYERMRNIAGLAVPIGKIVRAEIGYLNQFRLARGTARAQMDHALSIQLTLTRMLRRR